MQDFIKAIGLVRLGTIIGVTAGVLTGLMLIIFQLSQPPMTLLYSGLSYDDAGRIMQRLEQAGIPYEVKGNGTMIFAPKDQTLRLRMDLASDGLPSGGSVGYEIFDNMDMIGTTSFVQNINKLRALEGELARTISSLQTVSSARVHLVMPERSLFGENRQDPTASIMISGRTAQMNASQIQAIQNLVASAVPGLQPSHISIVDQRGNLLASANDDTSAMAVTASLDGRTVALEERIRKRVTDLIEKVVGPDKVRVQVNADIDYSRVVLQSESYDPDGQVVRSTQTIEESSSDTEKVSTEGVSVSNNLPETDIAPAGDDTKSASASNHTEETVNFEISKTVKTETQEAGRIKRLSVAVVVDGIYTEAPDGTRTYSPRSDEELERIKALVQSAIGFDENRGDSVEVLNLQFAEPPIEDAGEVEEPFLGLTGDDYMHIGQILASIIVSIILLMVLRTVLSRMTASGGDGTPALAAAGAAAQLEAPQDGAGALGSGEQTAALPPPQQNSALAGLDLAQIEGAVKDSSVKKVGELVSSHPEESIAILRSWLHQA